MTESAANRRRKRIVEHYLTGFNNANEAIVFGNTVEKIVTEHIGKVKFRQSIGGLKGLIITPEWKGPTALKTAFLELDGDIKAHFICSKVKETLENHNQVHRASVKLFNEVVREKPQPQIIG